jgi:putative copper resistance protein D
VLCAVGGGLLLTHSHAMFNIKAEFLSEVAHTPLGILGVFIAGGRWLELRLPAPDNRLPGRMWPACMMLLGLVLVFYREG